MFDFGSSFAMCEVHRSFSSKIRSNDLSTASVAPKIHCADAQADLQLHSYTVRLFPNTLVCNISSPRQVDSRISPMAGTAGKDGQG